jgi:hypothetical protein
MKLLPIATLVIAGAALAACGTTRDTRYNETAFADTSAPETKYEQVVYRTPAYGERHIYGDDVDVVYVQPAYRVVPAPRERVIYYYYD